MLTSLAKLYSRYRDAITGAATTIISNSLPVFESTFAPIQPPSGLSQSAIDEIVAGVLFFASIVSAGAFNVGTYNLLPSPAKNQSYPDTTKD
jgi:hypothetical protein